MVKLLPQNRLPGGPVDGGSSAGYSNSTDKNYHSGKLFLHSMIFDKPICLLSVNFVLINDSAHQIYQEPNYMIRYARKVSSLCLNFFSSNNMDFEIFLNLFYFLFEQLNSYLYNDPEFQKLSKKINV